MKTPLAWKNLVHNKVRTAVALAGVGFAVILIFMQMGFKGAVRKTATQIFDALDFDVMLRSPAYLHLTEPRTFPLQRINQAASLPQVESARPFYLGLSEWQAPQADDTPRESWKGEWRGIICMGVDPNDPPFIPQALKEEVARLSHPNYVLIDDKSKPEFGPKNGKRFNADDIGVETALGRDRVRIVGVVSLGTGLAANGACIASIEGFAAACYWQPLDEVNFGLIKLKPEFDALEVKRDMQQLLGAIGAKALESAAPGDVEVLTRDQVREREEYRWVEQTPLGRIFNLGVWVAVFVGIAIVYQVLSTDIANMMGEYATLKAMGYRSSYLIKVVLEQSMMLAIAGYVPSLLISWGLYELVGAQSGLPMIMTWQIALAVLSLAVVMCMVSGGFALRKLFQADPADLFK